MTYRCIQCGTRMPGAKTKHVEARGHLCVTCWRKANDAKPCLHCGSLVFSKKRGGLCWRCFDNPVVRELYPTKRVFNVPRDARKTGCGEPEEAPVFSSRQEGQAFYRCTWCNNFACYKPLWTCAACNAWYEQRKHLMNEDGAPEADNEACA